MSKQQTKFIPKKFVKFDLDAGQARQCKSWQPSVEELDTLLKRYQEDNYKFTFGLDRYNDCFQVMVQTDANVGPNRELIMVGRGSSPFRALKQILFKMNLFDEEWPVPDFQDKYRLEFDD